MKDPTIYSILNKFYWTSTKKMMKEHGTAGELRQWVSFRTDPKICQSMSLCRLYLCTPLWHSHSQLNNSKNGDRSQGIDFSFQPPIAIQMSWIKSVPLVLLNWLMDFFLSFIANSGEKVVNVCVCVWTFS